MSPKTIFENDDKLSSVLVENSPRVKQMTRKLGPVPTVDVDAIQSVDAELSQWINLGWKLTFVVRVATEPDGNTILYVLTKD